MRRVFAAGQAAVGGRQLNRRPAPHGAPRRRWRHADTSRIVLERALAEAELLNAIAQATAGEDELPRILATALDHLRRVIAFTGGSIALIEGEDMVIRAALGPFADSALGERLPRGRGQIWNVVETHAPFLCNDLAAAGFKTVNPLRSYLAVPLIWHSHALGVLEIDSIEPHAFNATDLLLMQKVAAALSGPIELARRYTAEVQALAAAEAMQRRLMLLAEASQILAASLDYETTLANVARVVVPAFSDWCAVDVVAEGRSIRRVAVVHADPTRVDLVEELWRRYPATLDGPSRVAHVLRTGQPDLFTQVSDDLLQSIAYDADHLRLLRAIGFTSAVIVPLIVRGEILGAITFVSAGSGRRYSTPDLELAMEIGRRAAQAVDNARLYCEAQDAVRARDVFLSIASHELKTPLTSLLGYVQLVTRRNAQSGSFDEREQRALRVIYEQASRLNRMVLALLDLSRLEMGQLTIEQAPVDVNALARQVVEVMQPALDRHDLQLVSDAGPLQVKGDMLRLYQVLENLIQNAVKYSPAGGVIRVEVERRGEHARIAIADQGIGIPQSAVPHLFRRFYRAPNAEALNMSGMGIGLYVVQEIVTLHGGEVRVESVEGRGSTFSVYLPIA